MAKQLENLIDKAMKLDEDSIQSVFPNEKANVQTRHVS